MLLLCSGDIELNPGPDCYVHGMGHWEKTYECGYKLRKGSRYFTASTGHPSSNINIEMHVPIGHPVGTT